MRRDASGGLLRDACLAAGCLLSLLGGSAGAATINWNDSVASGTWDTTNTNWNTATAIPWDATTGITNVANLTRNAGSYNVSGTVYANQILFPVNGTVGSTGTVTLGGTNPQISASFSAAVISAVLSGSPFRKVGGGTLTLSGTNTLSAGTVTVGNADTAAAGYLRLQSASALGDVTRISLPNTNTGTSGVQLQEGVSMPATLGIQTAGRSNSTTTGYILKNNSGDNAWNGSITITDLGGSYGFVSDGGTLTLAGQLTVDFAATTRSVSFGGAGNFLVSGNIVKTGSNGDMSVSKFGAGTLTLSGANTYGGSTTVSSGVLSIQSATALGATSSGTTVSEGAALEIEGGIVTAAEPLTISGTGVATGGVLRNVSGNNTFAGPITLAAVSRINSDAGQLTLSAATLPLAFDLTVGGAGDTVIESAVSGAGAFAKGGTGTVTLAGANSFGSGTFTLGTGSQNLGYLKLKSDTALGSHTTLRLQSSQSTGVSGVQLEGGVTIPQALETRGRGNADTTGYVIRNISGDNAWNGAVTIVDGGGGYGFIADAGTLTLGGTVSSTLNRDDLGPRGLSFTGPGDFVIAGDMIRNGAGAQDLNVSMNGTGRLVLSGTNTYTGPTSVNTGTLLINGNSSAATGAVSVALAGTLGGTGTVGGATTVSGIHAPGGSPGLQTFTNGLAYASTGTLVWELSANTDLSADRGVLYDGIDLTTAGSLAIDPAATLSLVFDAPLAGGSPSTVSWLDPFWDGDRQWTIIDVAAPVTWDEALFGTLTVGADAFGASLATARPNASFSLTGDSGNLVLQYSAVPEPGTLALAAAALAAAGWKLRRRPTAGAA